MRVYEFVVSGASVKHGAVISIVGGLEVTEPLESAPRRRSDDDEGGERESECSEDSMDVHETHDSEEDNSDLAPSVDTDVDSDVGSPTNACWTLEGVGPSMVLYDRHSWLHGY